MKELHCKVTGILLTSHLYNKQWCSSVIKLVKLLGHRYKCLFECQEKKHGELEDHYRARQLGQALCDSYTLLSNKIKNYIIAFNCFRLSVIATLWFLK